MAEPAWAIATLFPTQGSWSADDYLAFSAERPLVELVDGSIEVLPVPTDLHQRILDALFAILFAYARSAGDRARTSGIRLRLADRGFRQPDIVYLTAARLDLKGEDFWSGADLVVEVISPGPADRVRDLVTKRREYADAGIPEYWLVDPEEGTVTVLSLNAAQYVVNGVFARGDVARSKLLAGLQVDVTAVLDAN
jgi:Uma2 family endonuclease